MMNRNKVTMKLGYWMAIAALGSMGSLAAATAFAQDDSPALTVDEAISEAQAKSPIIQRARAAANEASWRPLEAISANLPQLRITGNHLFDAKFQELPLPPSMGGGMFPLIAPQSLLTLGAYWTVFDGLRGWNSFQAARQGDQAAQLELERATFSLSEQITLRFYQALGAQILADVAQQNVITLEDHLKKTKATLRRGSATKFDLLRVQVQLEQAVSDKLAADNDVVLARKNLAVAMGMTDDNRPLTGNMPVPDESKIPADLKPEFSKRTDIQALQVRADAAGKLHAAAIGGWIPSVTFSAEKQYYDNTNFNIWDTYHDAYALGFSLTWNVFDGGGTLARQRETAYRQQQEEATAQEALIRAPEEFETYRRRYFYNAALYRAKRRAVDMAEESVRLARLGYSAGTRTSTDVLDAELDLIRARAGVVRAQVDSVDALINLELAVGYKLSKVAHVP